MTFKVGDRVQWMRPRTQFPTRTQIPIGLGAWITEIDRVEPNIAVCFDDIIPDGHTAGNTAPDGRGWWCRPGDLGPADRPVVHPGTRVKWCGPLQWDGRIESVDEGVVIGHGTTFHCSYPRTLVRWDGMTYVVGIDPWLIRIIETPPTIVSATHHLQQLTAQAVQLIEEQT